MVDHDAKVAQRLGHRPHVLDLRDVGQAAALSGQGGCGQQLERRVLGTTDLDGAGERPTAFDPEHLADDRLRMELPVEWTCVSHSLNRGDADPPDVYAQ